MVAHIIDFSARNRLIVFLLVFGLALGGVWALQNTPVDAIPDLSDTQVIIYTTWMGRSPDLVEDQVTYPIVTTLLSAPKVTVVRGFSDFGYSYVYVLFQDGTDMYWARSRVLEYLSQLTDRMPPGVSPQLGPDATAVGWVFQYALVDESGQQDLASLRSFQDWSLRYWLRGIEGVAEVASVGGFVRQYQVNLDPTKVLAYQLSLPDIIEKIRMSNNDVGGRVVEFSGVEYMVRGRGYIKSTTDIEQIAVGVSQNGTPILLRDVSLVRLGPDMRRGLVELDGTGEVVGGIVIMRFGENAPQVIARVKAKLRDLEPALPPGVKVVTTYDRSDLIHESLATGTENLAEELIVVSVLIIIFLLHVRSALIPILTLPPGYTLTWSGQYEFMQRVRERLNVVIPLTLAIIFILFYFTFRSVTETLMVMLGVPLSLVGAVWYLVLLEYNMSIAVWVGIIAVAGTAAETSAVMLAYLNEAYHRRLTTSGIHSLAELIETIHAGAVERIRPMAMVPVMWATGTGADLMKRLAAPTVGGVLSAMLLTLIVIPALYTTWKWRWEVRPRLMV